MQPDTSTFTTTVQEELNYDPLQIIVHARLLGPRFLGRSTGQLEPEMLLKFQVLLCLLRSAPRRSKTRTCERVLTDNFNATSRSGVV